MYLPPIWILMFVKIFRKKFNSKKIDFLNIDVEGKELNVLESLIHDDKIYVISTTGVYVLYDNSLNPFDYRSWEKLNFNFDEPFGVVPNNGEIYFYSKTLIS